MALPTRFMSTWVTLDLSSSINAGMPPAYRAVGLMYFRAAFAFTTLKTTSTMLWIGW